jgi:hypothetical protein
MSHRYQYWDHIGRFGEATLVEVFPETYDRPSLQVRFDLEPLTQVSLAAIEGRVLAFDPVTDGPPEPLAGVRVSATPLLHSPVADIAPLHAITGEDGGYSLEVPADTPYLVHAFVDGYEPQWFRLARHPGDAEWVDVAPGRTTGGIDFELQPRSDEPLLGEIVGSVFRRDPDVRCENGERCLVPAVGALVRVTPAFPTFAPFERVARVAPDGSFRVTGLMADPEGTLSY